MGLTKPAQLRCRRSNPGYVQRHQRCAERDHTADAALFYATLLLRIASDGSVFSFAFYYWSVRAASTLLSHSSQKVV